MADRDLDSKLEEVEEDYRAGKVVFYHEQMPGALKVCLTYLFLILGELTESEYRKRKLRLEKEIMKRDYEDGM